MNYCFQRKEKYLRIFIVEDSEIENSTVNITVLSLLIVLV